MEKTATLNLRVNPTVKSSCGISIIKIRRTDVNSD